MTETDVENLKTELTNKIRKEQIQAVAKILKATANNHIRYWLQYIYALPSTAEWLWIGILRKSVSTFEDMCVYSFAEADKIRAYIREFEKGMITLREMDNAITDFLKEMEVKK